MQQGRLRNLKIRKRAVCLLLAVAIASFSLCSVSAATNMRKKMYVGSYIRLVVRNKHGVLKNVKWVSSNEKVAMVTKRGIIIALKRGKAVITGHVHGRTYTCKLKVVEGPHRVKGQSEEAFVQIE